MTSNDQSKVFGLPGVAQLSVPALAPALQPRGPVPDDIDAKLGMLALRAKDGDRDARNALFAAFAPRLDTWVRRAQGKYLCHAFDPAIELDDIAQLAFIVFADLLSAWSGQGTFSGFVIAHFPWRLSNSLLRSNHLRCGAPFPLRPHELLARDSFAGDEANALLLVLAGQLPPREGEILLLRIRDHLTWGQIAEHCGIDRRTALRDWDRILKRLRQELLPLL